MANIKSQIKRNKHQREGSPAQQGRQVLAEDGRPARSARPPTPATPTRPPPPLRDAASKLDKAVSKGVIHKNQAANRKSAMAKQAAGL